MTTVQQPWPLSRLDILDAAHLGYQEHLTNVIFKVIDNFDDLKQQVDDYLTTNDVKPLKIVYDVSQGGRCWATLIIYKAKTVYYMNPLGGVPDELERLFSAFIFMKKFSFPPCHPSDSGIIALDHTMKTNELQRSNQFIEQLRSDIEEQVNIMNTQRKKLETLLKIITKFPNDSPEFSYESANMFVYFLETVALQDEVVRKYKGQVTRIVGEDDVALVSRVRTKMLIHREASTPVLLEPKHLKVLIDQNNNNQVVQGFFNNLKNYITYTINKFYYRDLHNGVNEVAPSSFLKETAVALGRPVSQQEMDAEVETFLKRMLKEAFTDTRRNYDDEQKFIFYMIMNFAPYYIPNKKCPKALEKVKDLRNSQIHDFYKLSDGEYATKHAFINYLRDNRNCLFKHFYARHVTKLVKDLNDNIHNAILTDVTVTALKQSLETFKDEMGDSDALVVQPSIEQDCQLLLVVANENSIKLRKEKLCSYITSTRYDQLSIGDLMYIRRELMKLKQLKHDDMDLFNIHIASLKNLWETEYDITRNDLQLLIDLIVYDIGVTDSNYNKFIARIKSDLTALTTEVEYSINDSFTVDFVLQAYRRRGPRSRAHTKGAFFEKMSCLPEGYKTEIQLNTNYIVEIDTDRVVETIFEMRRNEERIRKEYSDVAEAFDDPVFLDYVEPGNQAAFPKLIDVKNIYKVPPFMAPLLARIIVKKGIKQLQPLDHVLTLLRDKSIRHFVNLLDYANDSKNKFSKVWSTLWVIVKDPNFNFSSFNVVFEECEREVIVNLFIEYIKCIKNAAESDKRDSKRVVWKLLQSFETVVVKKLFGDDHKGAILMLLAENEIKDIAEKTDNHVPEVLWRLKLTEAKIKWNVWELNKYRNRRDHEHYLSEALDILNKLARESNPEHFDKHYFVTFNYLGLALHAKGSPDKAYDNYIKLQKTFVEYILGAEVVDAGPWTDDIYKRILSNDHYKEISEDLNSSTTNYFDINDYSNVFRIRKNVAYHLQCRGIRNDNIDDLINALKVYEEVLRVLHTIGGDTMIREVIRTKKSLSKVYADLGKAFRNIGNSEEALKYYKENLKLATDLVEMQTNIFWASHPAVIEYFYFTIYAFRDIVRLGNYLQDSVKSELYKHFEKIVCSHIATVEKVSMKYKMQQINQYIAEITLLLSPISEYDEAEV